MRTTDSKAAINGMITNQESSGAVGVGVNVEICVGVGGGGLGATVDCVPGLVIATGSS